MKKLNLIPNQFYSFTYPNIKDFENIKRSVIKESFNQQPDGFGVKTIDVKLHQNRNYSELFNWIETCIDEVAKLEKFECDSMKICQSWANKNSPGQETHPHQHPNSIISGLFYLTEGEPTRFFIDNMWYTGFYPIRVQQDYLKYIDFTVKQSPCQLLLFPSSVHHSVDPNRTSSDRYTISFNTWMNGHWGDDGNLMGVNSQII